MVGNDGPVTLGFLLHQERQRRGWTTEQLGDAIGVSQQRASQIERGIGRPSRDKLPRVAEFLHIGIPETEALWAAVNTHSPTARTPTIPGGSVEERLARLEVQLQTMQDLVLLLAGRMGVDLIGAGMGMPYPMQQPRK